MQGGSPVAGCLAGALDGITPVEPEVVALAAAAARILADDVRLTTDRPPAAVVPRPGRAVAALAIAGASPHDPAALGQPVRVTAGMPMSPAPAQDRLGRGPGRARPPARRRRRCVHHAARATS